MVSRGRRTAPQATTIAPSALAKLATALQFIYASGERSTPGRTFRPTLPNTVAQRFAHFATRCQERPHSISPISPRAAKNGRTPLGPFPVTLQSRVTPPFPPTLAFIGRVVGVAGLYLSLNYECGAPTAVDPPAAGPGVDDNQNRACDFAGTRRRPDPSEAASDTLTAAHLAV